MIMSNARERTRFLRFLVVGTIGAVVDFGTFNLLTYGLHLNAIVSSVISFIAAVFSNFMWNRYWTYPDSRSKPIHHQMVQFLLVSLIGLGIRTPLFAWLERVLIRLAGNLLLPNFLTPSFLGHNVALAIAIVVVMLWNFFANRFWTYSDVAAT